MGYPTKNETYSKVFAMKELVLPISSQATLSSPESVVEPGPSASEEALASWVSFDTRVNDV